MNVMKCADRRATSGRLFPHLHDVGGEPAVEPDPVAGRDHADAGHAAEDGHPYDLPVVAEVIRVDLSAEDGQDQGQDCQQVDLSPKLQYGGIKISSDPFGFEVWPLKKSVWHDDNRFRFCVLTLTALQ